MSGCFDRQTIRRITAIQLDDCGRIATSGSIAIKGLRKGVNILNFTRNIDIPTVTPVKTVDGGTCVKPRPTPTDRGFAVALTMCGMNPIFESLAGYKTLEMNGTDVTGWEDVQITTNPKMALEVIFAPTSDSCSGGGEAQCYAMLIPSLEQWARSGDEAYNGSDIPDLVMTGQTGLNANLFENYTAETLPAWLAHWEPSFAAIETGRSWIYNRLVPCPAVDDGDFCTLVTL